jgi:peptidoglycan L-alanyl-D-glutamate endopeptidase CwlK
MRHTLYRGSRGRFVSELQGILGITQDGDFGPITNGAVRDFQRQNCLEVDGIVGPRTWAALLAQDEDEPPAPNPSITAFSDRTKGNISDLNGRFLDVLVPFLHEATRIAAASGLRLEVISGLRTWEEQADLYAQGRTKSGSVVTNARPGSSWHNFGLAVDLGLFDGRTYVDSKDPARAERVYRSIAEIAKEYGIEWGGNWRRFKDTPHFEYHPGLNLAEASRRLKSSGFDVQRVLT